MFFVNESEAEAIRAAFNRGGELAAAIALRRLFPGVTDNAQAQACVRMIVGWQAQPAASEPLSAPPAKRRPRPRTRVPVAT